MIYGGIIKIHWQKKELKTLQELFDKKSASLVVLKGRRRIGKSRLIEEFAAPYTFYTFTGQPPTKATTAQLERDMFAKQLYKAFGGTAPADDWVDLLWFLAERTQEGKVVILFDEISWMATKDPTFLGKLKTVWDTHFKKNPQLILILCGSVSSWIEKNILSNTGFLGRASLILTLGELPLSDCNKFWDDNQNIAAIEKFTLLSVTGGVPRYLEEIRPKLSAEENIHRLCFESSGILFNEFEQIFSDLFSSRSEIYKHIVMYLADKNSMRKEIAEQLDLELGGVISEYLDDLIKAGFIARDFSWNLRNGKSSALSQFRLSDNYLRFYLKYILPNKDKITTGFFLDNSLASFPGWATIMGLQFENLVLNNRKKIHELLGISGADIIASGPYFQRKTDKTPGCQIDYLIETKFSSLFICEIKFSKYTIKPDIIDEVKDKINRLKVPRHMSRRAVLIHVNGVQESVEDNDYFAKIISFADLLNQ